MGLKAPKTLAIDFDGTLCDFAFPGIGKVKQGAKEAIDKFRELGYKIIIYSCRTCHWHYDIFGGSPDQPVMERDRVKEMISWLAENGIEYDEVDDGSRGKPSANAYIDDKGIRFQDNWKEIQEFVEYADANGYI